MYHFSVDYWAFDGNITNTLEYLMKKAWDKVTYMFIWLLTGLINGSNHIKYVSLSNQKCMIQPIIINLHPNEYSQELHHYPFAVKLDRCAGRYNTLKDLFNKVCVPSKTEDLNIHVFNMIKGKNELKILTKVIWCKCKWKFDGTKCNSN